MLAAGNENEEFLLKFGPKSGIENVIAQDKLNQTVNNPATD